MKASLLFLLLTLFVISPAIAANPHPHFQCESDSDCVPITSLKQHCRHVDPDAKETCPAVNKKFAPEYARVDCATNTGCRPIENVSCRNGVCTGEEKVRPN